MKLDTSESYTVCFPQERKKQKRGAQKRERERLLTARFPGVYKRKP